MFCFCQKPLPRVLPLRGALPLRGDEHGTRCLRAQAVGPGPASHSPTPGSKFAWLLPSCRMTSHLEGDTQCLSVPGVGGRGSAGTLERGQGRGEQGLNPQTPMQVCLCPRRAAVRVHFSILIMKPLQHFLTDQSQAHQEGLVVKVAPLLSKRVLHCLALKM